MPEFKIAGIGASAGGLTALKALFDRLTPEPGMSFVVVVHLAPDQKSHLAELLQPHAPMPVQQVTETTKLEPNHIYVIPPNFNLDAVDTHLRLSSLETRRFDRAPIDHFFRTLADSNEGNAIGVVLSGSGRDGTLGLRRIKERGGVTIVQEPAEAEYDGMPRSAIGAGVVDLVLPVSEIAARVVGIARSSPDVPPADVDIESTLDENRLIARVFAQIRARTGHDFSEYKRSTILRRIGRRMQVNQIGSLSDYVVTLRDNRREIAALFDDLLITVTEFFRDPEVFEQLAKDVVPRLFERRQPYEAIRIWSAGCATGEEAYSLAMLMLEEAARREVRPNIQIFATDLHSRSLKTARDGEYPESISSDVSPERLRRFFQLENGAFRIRQEVRELVLFAAHDLLKDPPLSHLDLIVCRNLMIYLQRDVQCDVISLFHYALDPDGLVLLGTAETMDGTICSRRNTSRSAFIAGAASRRGTTGSLCSHPPCARTPNTIAFRSGGGRRRASAGFTRGWWSNMRLRASSSTRTMMSCTTRPTPVGISRSREGSRRAMCSSSSASRFDSSCVPHCRWRENEAPRFVPSLSP